MRASTWFKGLTESVSAVERKQQNLFKRRFGERKLLALSSLFKSLGFQKELKKILALGKLDVHKGENLLCCRQGIGRRKTESQKKNAQELFLGHDVEERLSERMNKFGRQIFLPNGECFHQHLGKGVEGVHSDTRKYAGTRVP